jgi:lysylphosphatidylglycerol synthetase-like protein (DUF2156 family)/UDP-2,3-diacylglucosamine pyrophosphatase LpxH
MTDEPTTATATEPDDLRRTSGCVPDRLEVPVPPGGRALVVSDLHLPSAPTPASRAAADEVARRLETWEGPGVVVLAGDCFELLGEGTTSPARALAAHPRLAGALHAFTGDGHRVVALAGNHDAALAWAPEAETALAGVGAEVAVTADLVAETGRGPARVRVEHGHRLDPANAWADPHDPKETPLGHHVVTELLPAVERRGPEWLCDFSAVADPGDGPAFVGSRLFYRRVVGHMGWLLLPFVLLALAHVPLLSRVGGVDLWSRRLGFAGLIVVGDLALLAGGLAVGARRAVRALSEVDLGPWSRAQNERVRDEATRLVDAGYAGLVTGHTHQAELSDLGGGFYANSGCGTDVVERRRGRFGLPPVFRSSRRLSWVELEAGAVLHVRLLHRAVGVPGGTILERLVGRRDPGPRQLTVVAALPTTADGPSSGWPLTPVPIPERRIRWRAASVLAAAGGVDLASALTPPLRNRLAALRAWVPLGVPHAAGGLVALAGVGLLLLARGVARGQRRAWRIAVALLALSTVGHLAKGLDVEEAAITLGLSGYLLAHRSRFRAPSDSASTRAGLVAVAGGAALAVTFGVAGLESGRLGGHHPPLGRAVAATAARLVGMAGPPVPERAGAVLSPVLGIVGLGLAIAAGWLLLRPTVRRRLPVGDLTRAREIVRRHGGDTLAYFALRSDKEHFLWRNSVVAYAVHHGVCLVSPDPVGPPAERAAVWRAFCQFVDEAGWTVAVLGATPEWLPLYRASGLHELYIGDEAVVDVTRFTLDGHRGKGLRQATNRVRRHGYRVEFFDPSRLDPALADQLRTLMVESRQGEGERGFSMTLGRVFDPSDRGLLLAVAFGPDGAPAAFCQFVPAPGIGGFSLDVMRRSAGAHPNGLTDFVVTETILHLRQHGGRGLGLNFATMRAVLAEETGDGFTERFQRWIFQRLSDSLQIESLWRYNAKYDPDWRPRYALYRSRADLPATGLAIARAEGVTELPLLGRFLGPPTPLTAAAPTPPENTLAGVAS